MSENDDIEVVEAYTEEVTEDGSVVAEDVIAAVDLDTGEAVVDDIVSRPDGNVIAIDCEWHGEWYHPDAYLRTIQFSAKAGEAFVDVPSLGDECVWCGDVTSP